MNRIHSNHLDSPMQQVDMIGKLADLKEQHYRNSLLLSALLELILEKGILSLTEIETKITQLDTAFNSELMYPTV